MYYIKKIKSFSLSNPRIFIFCLAFFYVVLAGLFIQIIFLPYFAPPSLSAGDGMLSGYDGAKFHRIAMDASRQINEFGWSAWRLRPDNQIVSGIASIFYSLITPKPWVLLPLNGILHGVASLALFEILSIIIGNRTLALFSTFPFILFPSTLLWNAQIHNENYVVPGVLLFLYGWIYLADFERGIQLKKSWTAILSIIIGSLMVWAVRDYIMTVLYILVFIPILLVVILITIRTIKKRINLKVLVIYIGLVGFVLFLSSPDLFNKIDPGFIYPQKSNNEQSSIGLDPETPEKSKNYIPWSYTAWLPGKIDANLYSLSSTRAKFIRIWSYAGSQIDTEIIFGRASDVFQYIPRALEIGFLAPFPSEWLAAGYKKSSSLMRKVSGAEMIIVYACLIGLFFSLWHFRAKIEIWVLSAVTIGMLIVYTCTIPNVGALYRFRYPYLMPLICLGLSGLILIFQKYFKATQSG